MPGKRPRQMRRTSSLSFISGDLPAERGPHDSNHQRSVIGCSQNQCQESSNIVGQSDATRQSGMASLNPCSGSIVHSADEEMLICGENDQVWEDSRRSKGVETTGNWQSLEVDLNAPPNSLSNHFSPNSFANSFSPKSFSPSSFSQSSSHSGNSGTTFSGTNSFFSSAFTGSHEIQSTRDGGPWPWDNNNNTNSDNNNSIKVQNSNDVESKRHDVNSATSIDLQKKEVDSGGSSLTSFSSHTSQSSHPPSNCSQYPLYSHPPSNRSQHPLYSHPPSLYSQYSHQYSQASPVSPIVHFSESDQKPYHPLAQEWSVWRSGEQSKRGYLHSSQDTKTSWTTTSTLTPPTPPPTSPSPWGYGVEGGVESWEPPVNAKIDQTGLDFLSLCNFCKASLDHHDIFMYGGEKAFCSQDCRQKEILRDERSAHYAATGRRFPMVPLVTSEKPQRRESGWGLFIGTAVVAS